MDSGFDAGGMYCLAWIMSSMFPSIAAQKACFENTMLKQTISGQLASMVSKNKITLKDRDS